ncbi:enoyl-CoA hydratase/isomerase family protein [Sandaracinus amylolyticus]|uniref:Enoyl-CoA hydratase n=1 Tax=Sandaracinus amylolyticus TaxID=927083 RepID=A0A0F6W3A6_9BACT|nr:enoyl-CoA hydratase/isomerase family protein [Sandaracinus amylolyticus]AKF06330.1 Enoyl-CoA hydratase [Sandaracinus amylolyticus]
MRYDGTQLSFDLGHGGVLEVRLHREPCNEIGLVMLSEVERVAEAAHAPGVRAMVITSAVKRGFCAGADLRELHRENAARASEPVEARVREVRRFLDRIHAAFDAIDAAPITTIAAVHGVCFGGGFELALTCDLIVADKTARFCFPELRLGLIPGFGGIPRLERDLGNAIIRDLLLTGRSLGAARAQAIGLVSQLVAPGEHLSVAHRVAQQACRFDGPTTKVAKAFLKPIPKDRLAREKDVFCELFAGPVVAKALARFDADTSAMPYLPAPPSSEQQDPA